MSACATGCAAGTGLCARSPDRVPLTETERQIMRVVDLYPGAAPSEIARRARLQRTSVSTALLSRGGQRLTDDRADQHERR